jgi:hypothetical protein
MQTNSRSESGLSAKHLKIHPNEIPRRQTGLALPRRALVLESSIRMKALRRLRDALLGESDAEARTRSANAHERLSTHVAL